VLLVEAIKAERAERIKRAREDAAGIERPAEVKEIRGEEAEKLAGPHLTGDPEFDAIELMETDPTRDLPRVKVTVRRG
jgi:hypothetical protein